MATGITVSVNYSINTIVKSGQMVEVMYTLTNSLAPLTKKYIDVYNELQLYSGLADTTTYTDVINDNFYNLAYDTMSAFADEARLIILNSIGSTAGTAVTGVVSFGLLENKTITKGISPFTVDYTYDDHKAGL